MEKSMKKISVNASKGGIGGFFKRYMNAGVAFMALATGTLLPTELMAAGFDSAITNIKSLGENAIPAIKAVFLMAGVGFLGLGIFKWIQLTNQQQPKGPAIVSIVAGVLLLSIVAFAGAIGETLGLTVEGLK